MGIIENISKIKRLKSQSITNFAGLFANPADDGNVTINIGNSGPGSGAAGG